jgi:hypothetical protein
VERRLQKGLCVRSSGQQLREEAEPAKGFVGLDVEKMLASFHKAIRGCEWIARVVALGAWGIHTQYQRPMRKGWSSLTHPD